MWDIDWTAFPGPMNGDEVAIWEERMKNWPRIPRDFDFDNLDRRTLWAYARAGWTLLDCHWRDGEE